MKRLGGLIGGSYECRICGRRHSSAIAHDDNEIPLPQDVQMFIEKTEEAVAEITFKEAGRRKIEHFFKDLRKKLNIPKDPIYAGDANLPEIKISKEEIKKVLKENLAVLEKIIKNNAFLNQNEAESVKEKFADLRYDIAEISRD